MAAKPERIRLDELLVRRGLVASREKAKALVLSGAVSVPGGPVPKPGLLVREDVVLRVAPARTYVSRGGIKLRHALDRFELDPAGKICADFGASTGGFTDCLLQRGAQKVYAVDVGYGQLDWGLRQDPRVVVMDRTNARYLEALDESVDLVTIDASFISLRLLLPSARRVSNETADIVALVKPQFEVGKGRLGKGGVVRDPADHREVLVTIADWLRAESFVLSGLTASPIRGPAGNVEFVARIRSDRVAEVDAETSIARALEEAGAILEESRG